MNRKTQNYANKLKLTSSLAWMMKLTLIVVLLCHVTESNALITYTASSGTITSNSSSETEYLIQPTGASKIEITFTSFFFEYDNVNAIYVYDSNTYEKQIANFDYQEYTINQWITMSITLNSTSNSLLIVTDYQNNVPPSFTCTYKAIYPEWTSNGTDIVYSLRSVGIGTSQPGLSLDVNGGIRSRLGAFQLNDGTNTGGGLYFYKTVTGGGNDLSPSLFAETGKSLYFMSGGSAVPKMTISSLGNVLIGQTSQTNTNYKLDVAGKVRANEIVVNTTGADFVFEKDYKLPSLQEVENYITQHKHLPGIAPAAEMEVEGASVGEMQTKLLQKLEEMTLYMIEMQKQIEQLKKENEQLKDKEGK